MQYCVMRIRPVGVSALLLECRDGAEVESWRAELWRRRSAGDFAAVEIVPGARTVLLDGVDQRVGDLLGTWTPSPAAVAQELPVVEIATTFAGDDLSDVAEHWEISSGQAIDRLTATEFTVAFCGFAPGFAYLRGMKAEWSVPRLAAPRPRVPAGSVALAGAYAGIYPSASPGGWRLVGHTTETLFDVRRQPPALLAPGTRVRLVAA
jgi:KipI family sensor histidine kinase inhibitor